MSDGKSAMSSGVMRLTNVSLLTSLECVQIHEIIMASGQPVIGNVLRIKALHRTLKTLADWITLHAAEGSSLSRKRIRQIEDAYRKLKQLVPDDPYMPNAPPPIPDVYLASMNSWIASNKQTDPDRSRGGAPEIWFDKFAYPRLLGFFELAYATRPTATNNGAAHRFLTAFFHHLAKAVAKLELGGRLADVRACERIAKHCKAPEPATLVWKIRNFVPDLVWIRQVLVEHEAALAEYNTQHHC